MNNNYLLGVAVAAALVGCGSLPHDWQAADTKQEATYQVFHVADWRTTMDIARHPGYYEVNPLIGNHPTNAVVNRYFLASGIVHAAITQALPQKYRPAWQIGTLLFKLGLVIHNFGIGLAIF